MIDSALILCLLMALFFGSHILLSLSKIRDGIINRYGELGFVLVFFIVAELTFAALMLFIKYSASSAYSLLPALQLPTPLLIILSGFGIALMVIGLMQFDKSTVLSNNETKISGIFKITRHPFFIGLAIVSWTHVLLAPTVITQWFFIGLGCYTVLGAWLQDKKLSARYGESYTEVMQTSSVLPFLALLQKKQTLNKTDIPITALLVSISFALFLRWVHPYFIDYYGIEILILVAIVGPGGLVIQGIKQRSQRST